MSLVEYRKKRTFRRTPEPRGLARRKPAAAHELRYVVQKHAARRLHYDFRLELDGTLLSWAVPKGPSLDPREKRLAVHVEDHPLEYAKFEGRIPEGEYGAGEVIVWDEGSWRPDGDPHRDLKRGKLEFHLQGKKLQGGWRLVRMKKGGAAKENWLLMKRADEAAKDERNFDVLENSPASVKTGRRLTKDEQGRGESPKAATAISSPKKERAAAEGLAAAFPLALATLVKKPPQGDEWLHEIKLDGYRLLVQVTTEKQKLKARLWTRSQLDWSERYPTLRDAAEILPVESALLDGELVALDEQGVSRFQLLQNAAKGIGSLTFFAFDLLELNGENLQSLPLAERKQKLKSLLEDARNTTIRYSEHITGQGADFYGESCKRGLEGIVSKRASAPYHHGRADEWQKVKCSGREELIIGGYTDSTSADRPFGALLVGYWQGEKLLYAGRVGTGFDARGLNSLHRRFAALGQAKSPFASIPPKERGGKVHWIKPKLVAEIAFGSWTDGKILRHAAFEGLREDKPAAEVKTPESLRQRAAHPHAKQGEKKMASSTKKNRSAGAASESENSIALTHPERILIPDVHFTKQDLADYYASVAEVMLPHLVDRPLSLLRCPDGLEGGCFFQKHAGLGMSAALHRFPITEKEKTRDYVIVNDADGLRALAQMSILEIHPWGSRTADIERPDRLIFDLDPGPDVAFQAVIEGALLVREVLTQLDLASFVKTSGGKGLHVVCPLTGRITWEELKNFSRGIAEHLSEEVPRAYTSKMAKAARQGKVFIDYLRNDRGATAIVPYSPRARAGAPISMPVAWEDLPKLKTAADFTFENHEKLRRRLTHDPWREFFDIKQKLPKFALQAK